MTMLYDSVHPNWILMYWGKCGEIGQIMITAIHCSEEWSGGHRFICPKVEHMIHTLFQHTRPSCEVYGGSPDC